MADIVERLRLLAAIDNCQASLEAAAEIERLRAALKELEGCDFHEGNCASLKIASLRIRDIARAALEGK